MFTFIQHGVEEAADRRDRGLRARRRPRAGAHAATCWSPPKGAKLGIPEAGVGLFAAAGGLLRLPSRVGYSKAMEMAITADPITAEEAFEYGMVARLVEKGEAVEVAMALAERVARNAPLAVAASKQLDQGHAGRHRGRVLGAPGVRSRRRCSLERRPRKARARSPRSARRSGPAPETDVSDRGPPGPRSFMQFGSGDAPSE